MLIFGDQPAPRLLSSSFQIFSICGVGLIQLPLFENDCGKLIYSRCVPNRARVPENPCFDKKTMRLVVAEDLHDRGYGRLPLNGIWRPAVSKGGYSAT